MSFVSHVGTFARDDAFLSWNTKLFAIVRCIVLVDCFFVCPYQEKCRRREKFLVVSKKFDIVFLLQRCISCDHRLVFDKFHFSVLDDFLNEIVLGQHLCFTSATRGMIVKGNCPFYSID